MSARALLFSQFLALLALSLIHIFGLTYYWYWIWRWLDIVTHLLGGLWAGFFVLWLATLLGKRVSLIQAVIIGFLIGIVWEIFENSIGALDLRAEWLDTLKDLSMDVVGACIAWFVSRALSNRAEK
ncbi:MAG: hypothetical protein HYS26_01310 [Candidatus Kaiserbacteria bacterium]|nr:MAG: hypothetical protein HYS26_01310 [Candidatus Kaiserbacteria bacterium]